MEFNHFLSAYYPDPSYGGDRLYADMIAQARLADAVGYRAVSIPEHHLINILLTPAPLQMAVKLAAETKNLRLVTSVAVLPLHDMRIFAGEVAQADILCEGRLTLGVGRGAFAYEMGRMGIAMEETRARFDESFNVLRALLSANEVSWDGDYYKFDPITIMPRPISNPVQMQLAALAPEAIYHSVKRGLHIQTTPLSGSGDLFRQQCDAFHRGRAELGEAGEHLTLSLSRVAYAARDTADAHKKLEMAHEYYKRFDNVFTGPGVVHDGCIAPLDRKQTVDELNENVLICPAAEMVDRLGQYAEAGVDEFIVNFNIGESQNETLEAMQRFAEDVMPHLTGRAVPQVRRQMQNRKETSHAHHSG